MLLVIDNYDSFTYNLVQYFGRLGVRQEVFRNDEITAEKAVALNPERVMISPGPCRPDDAGNSLEIVRAFAGSTPLLGVCLGHQCVAQCFGAKIVQADRIMHGKTSLIRHQGTGLFEGIGSPFKATRYHSLLVERESFPGELEVIAESDRGEIMALRHRRHPLWGVQFHPESHATEKGLQMLENFLHL